MDDDIVRYPESENGVTNQPRTLATVTDQLDAVPSAAPYVRIDKLLISVGYNQGTPCHSQIAELYPTQNAEPLTCQQTPKKI